MALPRKLGAGLFSVVVAGALASGYRQTEKCVASGCLWPAKAVGSLGLSFVCLSVSLALVLTCCGCATSQATEHQTTWPQEPDKSTETSAEGVWWFLQTMVYGFFQAGGPGAGK